MRFGKQVLTTLTMATFLTHTLQAKEAGRAKPAAEKAGAAKAAKSAKAGQKPGSHLGAKKPVRSYPREEVFLGYSYLRAAPTFATGNRLVHLNGGDASLATNFTRSFGVVTDFSGFADSQVALTGPGANPARTADSKGNAYTYLAGPRFSYRGHERIVPFIQVLAGGVHASEVTLTGCSGSACTVLPAQTSFAMTAGGGLDLKLSSHLAIRLVQAEYLYTRLASTTTGVSTNQNDIRLSSGLVFRFGGHHDLAAPNLNHAPSVSCSVEPSGPDAMLHAQASDPDGDPLTYRWSASAGHVDGTGPDAKWVPAGATPGTYTVNVLVDDGREGIATCGANVTVAAPQNHPPVLTCTADQTSIKAGDLFHLNVTAMDPDQDPITLVWETNGGKVTGSGTAVGLDTTGLSSGHVTMIGHAFDGRGGVAQCSVGVDVEGSLPPAIILVEQRLTLHSIYFPTAEPTVEQPNGGILASQKTILEMLANDFKVYLAARPNAHLVLEGHADPRASETYNQALTQRRVESTKRFLVEHGIPSDNITVHSLGDTEEMTTAQVREAVEHNSELTSTERQAMLEKIQTILLASNRRVDISLANSSQHSSREYPFNAKDSYTLLSQDQPGGTARKAPQAKKHPRP